MTRNTFKVSSNGTEEKQPSKLIPNVCFTTEESDETTQSFYEADDGSVASGVWECPPCRVDIDHYPVNEMMTIISGSLIVTNADGIEETFGPGEVLFVAQGSKLNWHITQRLKKYYMTAS
ncbi:MAG: DUF861 domain-containing protein [Pseudomonadales bacterium]|nr:DUF861 domain-containing protein [Pseudomonadales bacterium]MBO6594622.1 DUF861 domain-containing protein [Pseudomonadales bacterium]MBO6821818.1 DUF861 domain-containing protein [Pseudomonadales bacterium]